MRLAAVFALVMLSAARAADTSGTPSGEGDPGRVVCRAPQTLAGSRLLGPRVCKTNAVWAQYRKDGMDVAPDGIHDVPGEKYRTLHPGNCHPATMGGGNTSNMNQMNMSQICE